MRRGWAAALAGGAVLVLLLAAIWWGRTRPAAVVEPSTPPASAVPTAAPVPAENEATWTATLWLPGPREKIAPLEVELRSGATPLERARAVLAALLAERPDAPLAPLFDEPVLLAASVLTPDGTLYVDLRPAAGGEPPGSGSALELQRVYSIVHTVLRNEPELHRVVLLWNGIQRTSLSGHVDTGHALALMPEMESR